VNSRGHGETEGQTVRRIKEEGSSNSACPGATWWDYATCVETYHSEVWLEIDLKTVWAREVGMRKWEKVKEKGGGRGAKRTGKSKS